MLETNTLEKILEEISQYNQTFFPFSVIIPIVLAVISLVLVYHCFSQPGEKSSGLMKIFLAFLYAFIGYQNFSSGHGIIFAMGGGIMWFFSLLFILDIFWKKTEFKLSQASVLKILSLLLIGWGIFIYPLTEWLLGFTWPRMVLFGAECPTTIFTIGLLIGSLPNTSKIILALISIGAIISGGTFAFLGATFDTAYAASGICGLIMLIKYGKKVSFNPKQRITGGHVKR